MDQPIPFITTGGDGISLKVDNQAKEILDILKHLYAPIETRVANGEFTCRGGHKAFKEEVKRMEQAYSSTPESTKGPCGETALLLFQKEKIEDQLSSLLQTDKALTKEEKKKEALRRENEMVQQENAELEKQRKALEKHQEDMKVTYERNLNMDSDVKTQLKDTLTTATSDLKDWVEAGLMTTDEMVGAAHSLGQRSLFNSLTHPLQPQTMTDQEALLRCLETWKNHATEMTSSDDILVEPPNKRICLKSSKNDDDKGDPEGDFALALAEKHMQKDGGRSKIEEVLPSRAPETINGNDVKEWVCLYEEMLALEGDGTAMEKLNNELTALDYYDPKLLTKLEAIKELKLKFEAED